MCSDSTSPDKIAAVKEERNAIVQYAEKKRQTMTSFSPNDTAGSSSPAKTAKEMEAELSNTMLEQVATRVHGHTLQLIS
jgi:hypothetical protein